jgi:hypothetical protein
MRRRHSRTSAVGTGAPENIRFVDLAPAVLNLPEQIRNALLVPRNDLLLQLHDGMLIGRDLPGQFRLIQPASVSAMRYRRRQAGISYPVRAVPAQRKTPRPAGPGHGTVLPIAAKTSKPPAAVYTTQIEASDRTCGTPQRPRRSGHPRSRSFTAARASRRRPSRSRSATAQSWKTNARTPRRNGLSVC